MPRSAANRKTPCIKDVPASTLSLSSTKLASAPKTGPLKSPSPPTIFLTSSTCSVPQSRPSLVLAIEPVGFTAPFSENENIGLFP